ncbi:hypothetical protein [Catellatospora tritici]|uniref:hypothetical protein n=1 Tax=Catellatospora tritici TaxID=2851566 RepID=UPI001C2CF6DB|nr:hypothetical protein [Catellatospora tritici]MBV1849605.1 hypothetical protein [Catellatospora tritici]
MRAWFAPDIDVAGDGALGQAEAAFADALRRRTTSWNGDGVHSNLTRMESEEEPLLAYVGLSGLVDPVRGHGHEIFVAGLHYDGAGIRCDTLHNQLYHLPERPTEFAFEAFGGPTELGVAAAAWFEGILRRPVVRHEWLFLGRIYAYRYLMADSGYGLSQMYNRDLAPKRDSPPPATPMGWVRVAELGVPDRVVPVRTDGRRLPT